MSIYIYNVYDDMYIHNVTIVRRERKGREGEIRVRGPRVCASRRKAHCACRASAVTNTPLRPRDRLGLFRSRDPPTPTLQPETHTLPLTASPRQISAPGCRGPLYSSRGVPSTMGTPRSRSSGIASYWLVRATSLTTPNWTRKPGTSGWKP